MGLAAILASLFFLALLFFSIIGNGYSALFQTYINIDVFFDPGKIAKNDPSNGDYPGIVKASLRKMFPDAKGRSDKRRLYKLVSSGAAFQIRKMVLNDASLIGQQRSIWVPADDDVDMLMKGHLSRQDDNQSGRFNRQQLQWLDRLEAEKRVRKKFNITFFTAGDSREPELAGVWGAVAGSFFTLLVTLALSFPIGAACRSLFGRVCTQKSLDRSHRSQHQQPGGSAVHCFRVAGAGRVFEFFRPAPFSAAGGRIWCSP